MQPHDDDLVLRAMRGDAGTASDEALQSDLANELRDAARLGSIARAARDNGLTAGVEPAVDLGAIAASVHTALAEHRSSTTTTVAPPALADVLPNPEPVATVSSLADARRRRWIPAAAAAVIAVISFGLVAVLSDRGPSETVLAEANLDALGPSGGAVAELVEVDGELAVHVHTPGLTDAAVTSGDGYFEVWLLDPTASQLLSLGPASDDGVYPLPDGFDPATLPVVDVSVEHFDGDPTHSGDSRLRGVFDV